MKHFENFLENINLFRFKLDTHIRQSRIIRRN